MESNKNKTKKFSLTGLCILIPLWVAALVFLVLKTYNVSIACFAVATLLCVVFLILFIASRKKTGRDAAKPEPAPMEAAPVEAAPAEEPAPEPDAEEEVAEEEDAMFTEPMEPDNDNYRSSASELAKKMGYDLEKVGVILEFSMKNGEAAFTSEIVPFDNETQKALKAIDKELGGKQEGFCLRVNFGALKQFAKIADNLSSDDVLFMQMAANFVKYIELKYEGNCMVSLRMKTHDQSKTPVQSLVEMVSNYLDFI